MAQSSDTVYKPRASQAYFVQMLAVVLILLTAGAHARGETVAKPNFVFIAIDDLNDWVGYMGGHPQADTPNLDELAKRGVAFMNAHSVSPGCSPSRNAVLYGVEPYCTPSAPSGHIDPIA